MINGPASAQDDIELSYILSCKVAEPVSEQQHKTFNEWSKAGAASNLNQTSGRQLAQR